MKDSFILFSIIFVLFVWIGFLVAKELQNPNCNCNQMEIEIENLVSDINKIEIEKSSLEIEKMILEKEMERMNSLIKDIIGQPQYKRMIREEEKKHENKKD